MVNSEIIYRLGTSLIFSVDYKISSAIEPKITIEIPILKAPDLGVKYLSRFFFMVRG